MSWKHLSLQRKKTSSPALQRNQYSYKRGDMERANLMNLVKEGKISVDIAMQRAYGMGVASVPYEDLGSDNLALGEQFNFGVFLYSKHNKSTKCILHIDTGSRFVSLLQRGQELKKFSFSSLSHIDSTDDTTRLVISLFDMTNYEIDLSSLEDKNRVSRIFMSILEQHQSGDTDLNIRNDSFKERRQGVFKEGLLEKKGRSAARMIWLRRYVKVLPGEMMYFKVGDENDENNALSILRLTTSNTTIKKVDSNALSLTVNKKEYTFRLPVTTKNVNAEKERDDWILAIHSAMSNDEAKSKEVMSISNNDQEIYLKSVVRSLNDELEQLSTVLSVIDAPIRASTQVKRVREIVHSLNDQIHSGLLSWTLRSAIQNEDEETTILNKSVLSESSPQNISNAVNREMILNATVNEKDRHIKQTHNYYHLHTLPRKQSGDCYDDLNFQFNKGIDQTHVNNEAQANMNEINKNSKYDDYAPIEDVMQKVDEVKPAEYALIDKTVNKPEVYVNLSSDHFASNHIKPDLPPPIVPHDDKSIAHELPQNVVKHATKRNEFENVLHQKIEMSNSKEENIPSITKHAEASKNTDDSFIANKIAESSTTVSMIENDPANNEIPNNNEKVQNDTSVLNNIPLPPPLPGNFATELPYREFLEPACKMKPLFWTKIPDFSINKSVWKNAIDRSEQIDLEMLESLFYAGQEKSKSLNNIDKIGVSSNVVSKPSKSFLNPKKAQNLGIFLNGFKLSVDNLEVKLNTITNGLSVDEIIALKRFQPTAEEIELFKSIDVSDITLDADVFMHKLCSIDNLNERLDILLTVNELPDEYENINAPIRNIQIMLKFLRESNDLFRLFEYILTMGNYLNSGTNRGEAYGFKLSSLAKLSDILSYNKKLSLLDFIVEELYKTDKSAVVCCKSVSQYVYSLDISVKGICAEAEVIHKDIERLQQSVLKIENLLNEDFLNEINKFIEDYKGLTEKLKSDSKNIQVLIAELLRYFGENTSTDFDQWFKNLVKFLVDVNRVISNIESKQERLLKSGEAIDKTTTNQLSSTHPKSNKPPIPVAITGKEKAKSLPLNVAAYSISEFDIKDTVTQVNINNDQESPSRKGFLKKETNSTMKGKSKWENRYFEITESGYLQYSKKADSKASGKNIYLRGARIRLDASDNTILMIETSNGLLKMKANNELEALDWFTDLKYYSAAES